MKTNKWIYLIMIASLLWTACDDDEDGGNNRSLNDTDEMFVQKAATSNMAEVQLGQIAVTMATDSLVKAYAQEMIDDHTQAQDELEDIADDFSGVDWPNDLDDEHQAIIDQLDSMESGYTFDTLYIGTQIRMHEKATDIFSSAITSTNEARLKTYASKYLPILEQHLAKADSIQSEIMSNDTTGDADGNN